VIGISGMQSRKSQSCSPTTRKFRWVDDTEKTMTRFKLFGAAAILSALIATPTLAEPMNQEPGLAAFYHPNSDPNVGSSAPAADTMAMAPLRGHDEVMMKMKMMPHPARVRR
jgi:hypothetical protein